MDYSPLMNNLCSAPFVILLTAGFGLDVRTSVRERVRTSFCYGKSLMQLSMKLLKCNGEEEKHEFDF